LQPAKFDLASLGYQSRRVASFPIRENSSVLGTPLTVKGKIFDNGIGLTTPMIVDFPLRGARGMLTGILAIDDMALKDGSFDLTVLVDGKYINKTAVIRGGDAPIPFRFAIPPGETLTLQLEGAGDGASGDFADLINFEINAVRPPR
jgi:hypothetical protein